MADEDDRDVTDSADLDETDPPEGTSDVPADDGPADDAGDAGDPAAAPDSSPPAPTVSGRILVPHVPAGVRERLDELDGGDLTIVEDPDDADGVDLALLSTRIPRAELSGMLDAVAPLGVPVLALAHTGGESLAVDVLRRGGTGVIAEGNERALAGYLDDADTGTGLLDSYDRHVARVDTTEQSTLGRDPVTGLADGTALDVRLGTLEQEGKVPRIAFARVVRTPMVPEELGQDAAAMVRRRIANQFVNVARSHLSDVYWLSGWDFAVLGHTLTVDAAQQLGRDLDRVAVCYAPAGANPLGVAMGHAGPEVSEDIGTLREAAQRALEAAAGDRSQVVVSAETMALGVSSTTELEAALKAVAHVDEQTGADSHRVGAVAAALAAELGYDGIARSRIQLAGHLHAIGLAGLPADLVADPANLDDEQQQTYRTYPTRGADYLRVPAGNEVAGAVGSHRERFDGDGFPAGLEGRDIPVGARIVAVARVVEELEREGRAPGAIGERLDELSGVELDADVVRAAHTMLARP